MALTGALLLTLFAATTLASFDWLDEDNLIPSDGFHDLLGLTPFWLGDKSSAALRHTVTSKSCLSSSWPRLDIFGLNLAIELGTQWLRA